MRRIKLNKTELNVAPICLGTVNYGTAMPAPQAKRQLSEYVEKGGNFVDTAHVYGDWQPEIMSRSERVIGEWLRESGQRKSIVLVTKGAHPLLNEMNRPRVRPEYIECDLAGSLDSLGVDTIDLYFLHRDDPAIPVGEIIDFMEQKVTEGKIRYYGCSNWTLPRIIEANDYAESTGRRGFVCNQLMWSLAVINRESLDDPSMISMDRDTFLYHTETKLNAMAYMSAAKGYFMRRIAKGILPLSVKKVYSNPENEAIFHTLLLLSLDTGFPLADLSFLYFSGQPFPAIPIVTFSNEQQMIEDMRFCDANVDEELLKRLHNLRMQFVN